MEGIDLLGTGKRRDRLFIAADLFERVCLADPDSRIEWVDCTCLIKGNERIFVPFQADKAGCKPYPEICMIRSFSEDLAVEPDRLIILAVLEGRISVFKLSFENFWVDDYTFRPLPVLSSIIEYYRISYNGGTQTPWKALCRDPDDRKRVHLYGRLGSRECVCSMRGQG